MTPLTQTTARSECPVGKLSYSPKRLAHRVNRDARGVNGILQMSGGPVPQRLQGF